MELTRHQIIKTLHFEDLSNIGDILETLIPVYERAKHKSFESRTEMPDFIAEAMGPALDRLPSYVDAENREYAPEKVAVKHQGRGIDGLGEVMDTIHSDMRLLASKTARLFVPAIKAAIPPANLTGKFNPDDAKKLQGIDSIAIPMSAALPPLKVHSKDIVYRAFMLGAESRAHLTRSKDERELLENSVGTLKRSYLSLLGMLKELHHAMRADPAYKGKTPADFGLAPDIDKVVDAFQSRQKQFADAYNYMYVLTEGQVHPYMQDLKWAIENREKPKAGIAVTSSRDAAAAIAGLYDLLRNEVGYKRKVFCEELARRPDKEAALMMRQADVIGELRELADASPHSATEMFARRMVDVVESFQTRHLSPATWSDRSSRDSGRPISYP
jgi:hypothetical protein